MRKNKSNKINKSRTFATLATTALLSLASAATHAGQDWWWTPAKNGMGYAIGQTGDTVFLTWFMYEADGSPGFLMLSGKLSNGTLSGPLQRSTGPMPGPGFDPAGVSFADVGEATLSFDAKDYNRATFTYSYNGMRETVPLERFPYGGGVGVADKFGKAGAPQRWFDGQIYGATTKDDRNASFNFALKNNGPDSFNLHTEDGNVECDYLGTWHLVSSYINASGTFNCDNGDQGTFRAEKLTVSSDGLYYSGILHRTLGSATTKMIHHGYLDD